MTSARHPVVPRKAAGGSDHRRHVLSFLFLVSIRGDGSSLSLLCSSFHNTHKSNHHAVHLKSIEGFMSVIPPLKWEEKKKEKASRPGRCSQGVGLAHRGVAAFSSVSGALYRSIPRGEGGRGPPGTRRRGGSEGKLRALSARLHTPAHAGTRLHTL